MAIENVNTFIAIEQDLVHFNRQAWLNVTSSYTYLDEFGDEQTFQFPGYVSSFLTVYDGEERNEVLKQYTTQVTRNSNVQVMNMSVSDMTFESPGSYYYVLGYIQSGYEVALRYGQFIVK